jgi:tetratricopeptide (TPR) repeat protein
MNVGNVLWRLGRYDEARARLGGAAELANRPAGYRAMLPEIYLSGAEMALSERRPPEVKGKIKRLLGAADLGQNAELAAEVKRLSGLAQVLSGAKPEGARLCEEAVKLAETFGEPGLLSRTKLTFAQAALESGDGAKALEVASHLVDEFIRRGQHESAWQSLSIMARAAGQTGKRDEAAHHIARAEAELSKLRQQWGDEAFNDYLGRPDVRHFRNLLERVNRA